jgi:hypothetical protein
MYPLSPHMHPMTPPPLLPMTPQPPLHHPYYALGQLWSPPPPHPHVYAHPHAALFSPPPDAYHLHYPPPPPPPRPSSAEPVASQQMHSLPSGLPPSTGAAHPALVHGLPSVHACVPSSAHAHVQQPDVVVEAEREEGKGERASRVAQHLRMSSRHRSASPPSHRFGVTIEPLSDELYASVRGRPADASLRGAPAALPSTAAALAAQPFAPFRGTGAPRLSLGPLPPASFEVASPRPMPSPKMASGPDPFAQSLGRTERVAALEALAARAAGEDMSRGDVRGLGLVGLADGGDAGLAARMREVGLEPDFEPVPRRALDVGNKTLPGPPVPSTKPARAGGRGALDRLFPAPDVPEPKTPTLSALSLLKPPTARRESGLDALERRLAAEVGTRKVEAPARPDVRAVLSGLDIAAATAAGAAATGADDAVNDSAISSLSLGAEDVREHAREHARRRDREREREREREDDDEHDRDSEGRTHKGRGSHSDESDRRTTRHRERERESRRVDTERERKSDKERERGERRSDKERERESHRSDKERESHRSDKERESHRSDKERESHRSDKKRGGARRRGTGDREREDEAARMRRAAKGRIAAWLGAVDPDTAVAAEPDVASVSGSPPAGSPALDAVKRQASVQTLVLPPLAGAEDRAVVRKGSAQELKVERKRSAQELKVEHKPSARELKVDRKPSAQDLHVERRLVAATDAQERGLSAEQPKVERKTSAQDLRIDRRLSAVADGATLAALERKVERKLSADLRPAAQDLEAVERKASAQDFSAARSFANARKSSAQDLAVERPAASRKPSANDVKKPSVNDVKSDERPVPVRQLTEDDPARDTVRAPNPRSSGFVPMATLRARKETGPDDTPHVSPRQTAAQANPRARWEAALRKQEPTPVEKEDRSLPRRLSSVGQRVPAFLQQQQAVGGAKYDVRSARGGRGGKVTAVTALWANVEEDVAASPAAAKLPPSVMARSPLSVPSKSPLVVPAPKPKPVKPQTLMKGMGGANTRAAPSLSTAAVSSSHATPTLSSTASLSRPAAAAAPPRTARVPPVITEEPVPAPTPVVVKAAPAPAAVPAVPAVKSGKPTAPKAELAFGQARLRDLIRKYQGQAN